MHLIVSPLEGLFFLTQRGKNALSSRGLHLSNPVFTSANDHVLAFVGRAKIITLCAQCNCAVYLDLFIHIRTLNM